MIKYAAAALALKAFGLNSYTRGAYRALGNHFGSRGRLGASALDTYVARGELLVALARRYRFANTDEHVLELGTGWMHWFSLYLRTVHAPRITMMDIWDCRQLDVLKAAFGAVSKPGTPFTAGPMHNEVMTAIERAGSFDELYQSLGLRYQVAAEGDFRRFADETIDGVLSFHVLEHVPEIFVSHLTRDMYRALKPGALVIHQIGIDDHLQHYDPSMSPKNYVRYSDRIWKLFFENKIQYFNRIQASEWVRHFEKAGFSILEKTLEHCDMHGVRPNARFSAYSQEDLSGTIFTIVARKD